MTHKLNSIAKICMIFISLFIINSIQASEKKLIIKSKEFLEPIIWPYDSNNDKVYEKIIHGDIEHPLQIGSTAVRYFYKGLINNDQISITKAKNILHVLDNYPYVQKNYNSIVYLYNIDVPPFKAKKWWSGMANSSIAVAYLLGYKITKNKKYLLSAQMAMNGTINTIRHNGSAIHLDANSTWYLEYADKQRSINNSDFVLNGFQYSLCCLAFFKENLTDPIYQEAYKRGVNAYKKNHEKYYYPHHDWFYYMLNPLTIESPHYAIFDQMLTNALSAHDKNNKFLYKEAQKRKKIFNYYYNFEKCPDGTLLFSTVGPPHPYWIDIYPIKFIIHFNDNHIEERYITPKGDFTIPVSQRLFLEIEKKKAENIQYIDGFLNYNTQNYHLLHTDIKDLQSINVSDARLQTVLTSKSFSYNAFLDNNHTYIKFDKNATLTRAGIIYSLKKPIDLWKKKYFAIFLQNSIELDTIRVIIIDKNNQTSERYYPGQKAGKNLILLSSLGFRNQSIDHEIKTIIFYLYGKKNLSKKALIDTSELIIINSNKALYDLMKKNDESNNSMFFFKEKRVTIH